MWISSKLDLLNDWSALATLTVAMFAGDSASALLDKQEQSQDFVPVPSKANSNRASTLRKVRHMICVRAYVASLQTFGAGGKELLHTLLVSRFH